MDEDINNYDDIINLTHPEPVNRHRMSMMARAAQFAPFAALTGHDAAIAETGRYTDSPIELGEALTQELDRTLAVLQERIHQHPVVRISHFVPDGHKAGGSYASITAPVKRLDLDSRAIILDDNTPIPLSNILTMQVL